MSNKSPNDSSDRHLTMTRQKLLPPYRMNQFCICLMQTTKKQNMWLDSLQYRKFLLQHTDFYPTHHQWVITQSFAASDCLMAYISHKLGLHLNSSLSPNLNGPGLL